MSLPFDDASAPLYTVGQVAEILDVEGVVQPARSAGGQRRYNRNEIAFAQHVSQMADAGMPLPGIRRILILEAEVAALRAQLAEAQPPPVG